MDRELEHSALLEQSHERIKVQKKNHLEKTQHAT
jgi:hypothetical protein